MVPDVKIYPRISRVKRSDYILSYISPISESHYQSYGNVCAVNIIGATSGKKKIDCRKVFFQ